MKIFGAHTIIYSKDAEADRRFFRDVLKYRNVDVGGGWLVFALPPGELAVHPSDDNDVHELYLVCDDVKAVAAAMKKQEIPCSPIHEERWGSLVHVTLPGGGKLGIYQPKHALAIRRPRSR
jgi:catechol 2,3-dioxygenase-like lactoylglutathione lyase family enzyme